MSSPANNNYDISKFIRDITSENNWGSIIEIKYYSEDESDNGYASNYVYVDIITENKSCKLVIKHALDMKIAVEVLYKKYYSNEAFFYEIIYPAYTDFLQEKDVGYGFQNVLKCYGTSAKNVIALENLKLKGFAFFDKNNVMNDKHITLVLKTFAKFHAISFAFKDQRKEEYKKFTKYLCKDFLGLETKGYSSFSITVISDMISDVLSKLDAMTDRRIVNKCNVRNLLDTVVNIEETVSVFSILTQGESWCDNMMFLYEKHDKESPIDVVFLDWHLIRHASPVCDISNFLYTIASEESLKKLDIYLKFYYTELCREIRKLGSNPGIIYPGPIFKREWKQYCRYGFASAFVLIRFMLVDKHEVPRFQEEQDNKLNSTNEIEFFPKFSKESEYVNRIRLLGSFMTAKGYL